MLALNDNMFPFPTILLSLSHLMWTRIGLELFTLQHRRTLLPFFTRKDLGQRSIAGFSISGEINDNLLERLNPQWEFPVMIRVVMKV